jgi:hypothetical protein
VTVPPPEPITPAWLASNRFRPVPQDRGGPHWVRPVGAEKRGGLRPFEAHDDLGIELADGGDGEWFCWVVQQEPRKHLHVRMLAETWEVVRLWEGLTGRTWSSPADVPIEGND